MQASLETLSTLERRLKVAVPVQQIDTEIENRLKRIQRTVKLHGFRPGKVPMKVVAQQYGPQVRQEVLGDTVERTFGEAVKEKNLRVAGYPKIETQAAAEDAGAFEFTATFEVFPEVAIGDISKVVVERPAVSVGDTEVDKTIDVLRKQRTQYNKVDRAAKDGDAVVIDYVGTMDGEAFEGGSAKGQAVVLGEGRLLPDFEKQLSGMSAGETRTFELVFPEDYHDKGVAGKAASFDVTLVAVQEPIVPEVDAEFAKTLGIEDGDIGRMREDVRVNLEREVDRRVQARVKDQALKALMDNATLEVPKALVDMEVNRLMAGTAESMKARGMSEQLDNMPRDVFEPEARRRVLIGLVLAEIVRAEGIRAEPDQVRKVVEDYAQSYEHPEEVVRWYYQSPDRVREVESVVVENNVVDWLLGKVSVVEKTVDFDELMGNGR
ncbi:MAG: trigger factor [Betaproteobacteria bacterium]|nr:trigger factor [Betaproteobacteria bacterium]